MCKIFRGLSDIKGCLMGLKNKAFVLELVFIHGKLHV